MPQPTVDTAGPASTDRVEALESPIAGRTHRGHGPGPPPARRAHRRRLGAALHPVRLRAHCGQHRWEQCALPCVGHDRAAHRKSAVESFEGRG